MIKIESTIIKIGNSKGIRIPSFILKQLNLNVKDSIDLNIEDNMIVIKKKLKPRHSWNEAFKKMNENNDDKLQELNYLIK